MPRRAWSKRPSRQSTSAPRTSPAVHAGIVLRAASIWALSCSSWPWPAAVSRIIEATEVVRPSPLYDDDLKRRVPLIERLKGRGIGNDRFAEIALHLGHLPEVESRQ